MPHIRVALIAVPLMASLAACGGGARTVPPAPVAPAVGKSLPGAPDAPAVRRLTPGQTVEGRLTSSDPRLPVDRAYHLWLFSGTAGQRLIIEMNSSAVDPYLILEDASGAEIGRDDDGGEGLNARLTVTLPADGEYRIRANSFRSNSFGSYTLRLAEPQPERVRSLTLGQEVTERLTAEDPEMTGNRPVHTWQFTGAAGQRVIIEMISSAVDPHLILEDSVGGELARDDDGGEGLNARLEFTLPVAGAYRIRANSFRAGAYGSYTLRLAEPAPERLRALAVGQEVNERLTRDDPRMPTNRPYHIWQFAGKAGQHVVIEMHSTAVDAHLILEDALGREVTRDDDGGGGRDALVDWVLASSGTWRVRASGLTSDQFGEYTLRLGEAAPERVRRIALREDVTDRLTSTDPRIATNRPYHTWRFSGTAGQFVMIEMQSAAVDAHLVLQDSSGIQLASNDDGGGGTNARLRYTLPDGGEYRIVASSFVSGRYGEYTLRVSPGAAPATSMVGVVDSIARRQTRSGNLGPEDQTRTAQLLTRVVDGSGRQTGLQIGQRESRWRAYLYRARAGETVVIDLRSPSLDMLLHVQEADGTLIAFDDDGGEGLDSRLTFVFPYTGTFRLVVTTAAATTMGPYQLSVH